MLRDILRGGTYVPAKVVDRLLWDWSVLNNLTGQNILKIFGNVLQMKYPSLEPPAYTLTNMWIFSKGVYCGHWQKKQVLDKKVVCHDGLI